MATMKKRTLGRDEIDAVMDAVDAVLTEAIVAAQKKQWNDYRVRLSLHYLGEKAEAHGKLPNKESAEARARQCRRLLTAMIRDRIESRT